MYLQGAGGVDADECRLRSIKFLRIEPGVLQEWKSVRGWYVLLCQRVAGDAVEQREKHRRKTGERKRDRIENKYADSIASSTILAQFLN